MASLQQSMRYSWLPLSLLVAAFLAFVGTAMGASQSLGELLERDAERSQALRTQTELQRLLMLLVDIETGQRGFMIAGQQPLLRPYVVVQIRLGQAEQAASHARSLVALMSEPFHVGGRDYVLGIEMGMALFPANAVSPRGLLTLAQATAFGAL